MSIPTAIIFIVSQTTALTRIAPSLNDRGFVAYVCRDDDSEICAIKSDGSSAVRLNTERRIRCPPLISIRFSVNVKTKNSEFDKFPMLFIINRYPKILLTMGWGRMFKNIVSILIISGLLTMTAIAPYAYWPRFSRAVQRRLCSRKRPWTQ